MTSLQRYSVLLLTLFAFSGNALAAKPRLLLIGDANLPTGLKFKGTDFGGLSGLVFDSLASELRIISDDKSEKQPARFYSARLTAEAGRLRFLPVAFTLLRDRKGLTFPKGMIDPEGIALHGSRLYITTEGNGRSVPREMPGILEFDEAGRELGKFVVPSKYLPEARGPQTKGTVDNGAFESLTISPAEQFLFTATEMPLVQDDTPATFLKGGKSRILVYKLSSGRGTPFAEYVYETEPNAKPADATNDFGNGIAEMLALGERTLLVLERGAAATPSKTPTRIRIYKVVLGGSATNVAGFSSLKGRKFRSLKKELILDLDTILPQLDRDFRSTDNIEGMAFGPRLPNGNRSLVLISDNNFNPLQRTQILAFEIRD